MKRILTILCGMLCITLSLSAQEHPEEEYYYAGQSFIGGSVAIGRIPPYSGGLLGANYVRTLAKRFSVGVGANVGFINPGDSVPFFSIAPFARYNLVMEGPVALYGQANLVVAMLFPEERNGGVIWPNLSAGISYRLSKHFTVFGQMGLVHVIAIPFGNMFSREDSGSSDDPGSSGYSGYSLSDLPLLFSVTNRPEIGIYYTF